MQKRSLRNVGSFNEDIQIRDGMATGSQEEQRAGGLNEESKKAGSIFEAGQTE
jgi:hypothetical protein